MCTGAAKLLVGRSASMAVGAISPRGLVEHDLEGGEVMSMAEFRLVEPTKAVMSALVNFIF